MHSQTTLVQGQRGELTDSYSGVLGLRENKKGLPADRLVVKLESTTDSGILMCFISKSSCYPTKEKPRVCTGLTCCSLGGTIFLACLRSNRSIDWPRSQCPPPPASTLKLRRLENVVLYFVCTVLLYHTVQYIPRETGSPWSYS